MKLETPDSSSRFWSTDQKEVKRIGVVVNVVVFLQSSRGFSFYLFRTGNNYYQAKVLGFEIEK